MKNLAMFAGQALLKTEREPIPPAPEPKIRTWQDVYNLGTWRDIFYLGDWQDVYQEAV